MSPEPHREGASKRRRTPRREALRRAGPLEGELAADFEAWLESARGRHLPPLTPRELHSGVRALSARYVEGRGEPMARRALEGAGKRAAFATYYAPLHFLIAWHAARATFAAELAAIERISDFGCGSAPLAAAVARATPPGRPRPLAISGVDASGWALGEARHTLASFGLAGRLTRGRLPAALPRPAAGEFWGFGWVVNELDTREREALLTKLEAALAHGVRLLLIEPLAGGVSPWWDEWAETLAPRGVVADELRVRPELPARLREIDRATRLRHDEIGARLLHGPHP